MKGLNEKISAMAQFLACNPDAVSVTKVFGSVGVAELAEDFDIILTLQRTELPKNSSKIIRPLNPPKGIKSS